MTLCTQILQRPIDYYACWQRMYPSLDWPDCPLLVVPEGAWIDVEALADGQRILWIPGETDAAWNVRREQ